MITTNIIVSALAGVVLGVFIGFLIRKRIIERQFESIKSYSKKIINEAHRQAKTVKKRLCFARKIPYIR